MLIGVFGTGRNGSSLIVRLLDGMGSTYVHPVEERFFTAFDDLARHGRVGRRVQQNCVRRPLRHLDRKLAREELAPYFAEGFPELQALWAETVGAAPGAALSLAELVPERRYDAAEFTRAWLEGLARRVRPDLRLDHQLFKSIETPYLADYEARLADLRFVHIVRHPVPVCSSQKRSILETKRLPASHLGFDYLSCMLDMRWVPHARFLAERRDDPRHVVVRYEDLVREPRAEVLRVADALGLAPPPRPETQTVFCDHARERWGSNPSKLDVEMPAAVVPDLQERYGYEEVLTPREIDLIAVKTRDFLDLFGYESPSEASRLRTALEFLPPDRWELMHCRTPRTLLRGLVGMAYRRLAAAR